MAVDDDVEVIMSVVSDRENLFSFWRIFLRFTKTYLLLPKLHLQDGTLATSVNDQVSSDLDNNMHSIPMDNFPYMLSLHVTS
jgi:hypothetical protein